MKYKFKEIKISNKSEELVNRFNFFVSNYQRSKIISVTLSSFPKLLFEIGLLIFFYISFLETDLSINLFIAKFSVLVITLIRILPPLSRIFSYGSIILYNFESLKVLVDDYKEKSIPSIETKKKYNFVNKKALKCYYNIRRKYSNFFAIFSDFIRIPTTTCYSVSHILILYFIIKFRQINFATSTIILICLLFFIFKFPASGTPCV
jgi:hypothetical protein